MSRGWHARIPREREARLQTISGPWTLAPRVLREMTVLPWHPICLVSVQAGRTELNSMDHLFRNLHLYKRMKELAVQQESCVSEDRMELFLQLANQREQLRLQITANQEKRASFQKSPPPHRRESAAASLAADIADVIRSIQEIDRKTEEFVFRRKESILSDLSSLRMGRKAVRGYGGRAGAGDPRFIDRKS